MLQLWKKKGFVTLSIFVFCGLFVETQHAWPQEQKEIPIAIEQSFGFPTQKYIHPLVSPDEKWLIYHRTDVDWNLKTVSGFLFGDVDDIVWKKIFYSKVGRCDKEVVPLPRLKTGQNYRQVGMCEKWSPDGKFLAFFVDIDAKDESGGNYIVLVDFSGPRPILIESFRASDDSNIDFWSPDEILYIDEHNKGMLRKKIGGEAIKVIDFQDGKRDKGHVYYYQLSSDGTLIYNYRYFGNSIYTTNLSAPSHFTLLFSDEKEPARRSKDDLRAHSNDMRQNPVFQDKPIPKDFTISPDGKYAAFYYPPGSETSTQRVSLVLLGTSLTVNEFYIAEGSRVRWSPSGAKLAYIEGTSVQNKDSDNASQRIWPNPRFFVLDTMAMKRKDYGIGVTENFGWTPDGKHIIYSMKYAHPSIGAYKNGIFIMRVSDGKEIGRLSRISATPGDSGTLTPSGRYVFWQALNIHAFFLVENPFRREMNANQE